LRSVDCKIENGTASDKVTDKKTNQTTQQDIPLGSVTMIMAENTVAWLDLMYSTLALKAGKSFTVPAFFPDDFQKQNITINVLSSQTSITVNGKIYMVFVCNVPALNETHYVTGNGQLVKVERAGTNIAIELAEQIDP